MELEELDIRLVRRKSGSLSLEECILKSSTSSLLAFDVTSSVVSHTFDSLASMIVPETASYALNAPNISTGSKYNITSSWATSSVSSSYSTTSDTSVSSSYSITSSYALRSDQSISSSFASNATTIASGSSFFITSSWATSSISASYVPLQSSSSYSLSSSYALNSKSTLTASGYLPLAGGTMTGLLTLTSDNAGSPSLTITGGGASASLYAVGGQLQIGGQNYNSRKCFGVDLATGDIKLNDTSTLYWTGGNSYSGTPDVILVRDAAGIFAQRNSTNAQTLRVYGTYTDSSNYVRAALSCSTTVVTLAAESGGTGADDVRLNLTSAGSGGVKITGLAGINTDPETNLGTGTALLIRQPGSTGAGTACLIRGIGYGGSSTVFAVFDDGSMSVAGFAGFSSNGLGTSSGGGPAFFRLSHTSYFTTELRQSDTFQIYDATASAARLTVSATGNVGIGTTSPGAQLQVNCGAAATTGSIIKGAASQTADLLQFQNSSGTTLASVSSTGVVDANLLYLQGSLALSPVSTTLRIGYGGFSTFQFGSGNNYIVPEAANVISLRNSTTAQTFRVYGTYTDANNYVRSILHCSSSGVTLAAESAGTGASHPFISLKPKGSNGAVYIQLNDAALLQDGFMHAKDNNVTYLKSHKGGTGLFAYNQSAYGQGLLHRSVNGMGLTSYDCITQRGDHLYFTGACIGAGLWAPLTNLVAGQSFNGSGQYTLTGLVAGEYFNWFSQGNITSITNGTQTCTAYGSSGGFVAQGTSVVVNGTPSAAITGVIYRPAPSLIVSTSTYTQGQAGQMKSAVHLSAKCGGANVYAPFITADMNFDARIFRFYTGGDQQQVSNVNNGAYVGGLSGVGTEVFRINELGNIGIRTTSPGAQLQVTCGAAGTIGQIIKGAASQTAYLLQFQNSSGTTLASVSASGAISSSLFIATTFQGTASVALSSSNASFATSASWAPASPSESSSYAESASWSEFAGTLLGSVESASYSLSSSYAESSSWAEFAGTLLGTVESSSYSLSSSWSDVAGFVESSSYSLSSSWSDVAGFVESSSYSLSSSWADSAGTVESSSYSLSSSWADSAGFAESSSYSLSSSWADVAGFVESSSYSLASSISDVASVLSIPEANERMGIATLTAGTVTVSNTIVTATSRIFLTAQSLGTITVPAAYAISARTATTDFTILSSDATDTSEVAWMIVEPA